MIDRKNNTQEGWFLLMVAFRHLHRSHFRSLKASWNPWNPMLSFCDVLGHRALMQLTLKSSWLSRRNLHLGSLVLVWCHGLLKNLTSQKKGAGLGPKKLIIRTATVIQVKTAKRMKGGKALHNLQYLRIERVIFYWQSSREMGTNTWFKKWLLFWGGGVFHGRKRQVYPETPFPNRSSAKQIYHSNLFR